MKPRLRPDGWYEISYYVNGSRRRALGKTAKDAAAKAVEALKREERTPVLQPVDRNMTLRSYVERFLRDAVDDIEPKTVRDYRWALESHVLCFRPEDGGTLGGKKIWEIRRRHIKALLRSKVHYAKNTVRNIRAALSSVLSEAVDDELIEMNPAIGLSKRRKHRYGDTPAEEEQKIRVMLGHQLERFNQACRGETECGVLYYTIGKTGLRPSEAVVLRPEDVNFENGKIRINKAWASGRVRPYTKTGKPRCVDISPQLGEVLKRHIDWVRERFLRLRRPEPEWLFPSREDSIIDPNNAADAFLRICGKAGIGHFSPYDLRHTFASLLISRGAPVQYVQLQLGHETLVTTLKYYATWVPPAKDPGYINLIDTEPVAKIRQAVSGERYIDLIDKTEAASNDVRQDSASAETAQAGHNSATEFCHIIDFPILENPGSLLESFGEPCRNRTYNLLIKSQLLCQLS
jgi:integrase